MDIIWSRVSSASSYKDGVFSVCVYGDRVYAVGFDEYCGPGKRRYRVEVYGSRDGTPIARWADEKCYSIASLTACAVAKGNIYVFGATENFWTALAFDRDLNLVKRVDRERPLIVPFSATVLGDYIYLAGTGYTQHGSTSMYVAKVSPDDLSIVKEFSTDIRGAGAGAYAVTCSRTTKRIVLGGYDRTEGVMNWLVAFLTEDLEPVRFSRPGIRGCIMGLAIDSKDFIYAVSRGKAAKLGREGDVLISSTSLQGVKAYASQDQPQSIGTNVVIALDNEVHVVTSDNLSVVDSARLSKGPQMLTAFPGSMDADANNIYIALTQIVTRDDWNWAIIALRPRTARKIVPPFLGRR